MIEAVKNGTFMDRPAWKTLIKYMCGGWLGCTKDGGPLFYIRLGLGVWKAQYSRLNMDDLILLQLATREMCFQGLVPVLIDLALNAPGPIIPRLPLLHLHLETILLMSVSAIV